MFSPQQQSLTSISGRTLGIHERVCVGFTNEWFAMTLCQLMAYDVDNLPTRETLRHRLQAMIANPLLRASVPNPDDARPRFSVIPISEYDLDRRIEEKSIGNPTETTLNHIKANLLQQELDHGHRDFDFRSGYLWSVTRYTPSQQSGLGFIALSIHHSLCDGLGSMKLAYQLLGPEVQPSLAPEVPFPPTLESTIPVALSLIDLCKTVVNQRILPVLRPSRITMEVPPVCWPVSGKEFATSPEPQIRIDPRLCETRVIAFALPASLVVKLKAASKKMGSGTLQPVLAAALFAACHAAHSSKTEAINVKHVTPFSLRDSELGHPFATGNYIAVHALPQTVRGDDHFGTIARAYAVDIRDETKRQSAIESWGKKEWLPHGEKTGMETKYAAAQPPQYPYDSSVVFSNLGLIDNEVEALPGLEGLVFAQGHHPFGAAITVNMEGRPTPNSGTEIGMSWSWKDRSCPDGQLDAEKVHDLAALYQRILRIVANRWESSGEDIQISALCELAADTTRVN